MQSQLHREHVVHALPCGSLLLLRDSLQAFRNSPNSTQLNWMAHNLALAMLQRKGSILGRRRISGLFTPKLIDINEKNHTRQPSDLSRLSVLLSPAPRSPKDSSRAGSLQDAFQAAVPAEEPTEPYLILQNKYPAIRSMRRDEDTGDGMWLCCHCRHENILRHFTGPYLFQYLRCGRCDRHICSDCHSS
jgi:hypothetical protein